MNHHLKHRNSLERFPRDLVPNMVSSSPTPSRGRTALLACPPFSRFPLSRGLLSAVFQGSCHWQPPGNNKIPSTAEERRQLNWGVVMNAHTDSQYESTMPHIHLLRLLGLHARQIFSLLYVYGTIRNKHIGAGFLLKLHSQGNELTGMSCETQVTVCMAHIHHYILCGGLHY